MTELVADAGHLKIAGAARLIFEQTSASAFDPRLRSFLCDLVTPYGVELREDLLAEGAGHSFSEMAEPLIAELAPEGSAPLDLLVLAYDLHDLQPGRATATYLSHLCAGTPLAFSVCDQGPAAAFSALRLIQVYAGTGDHFRALLLVVEQSGLHYEPAATPAAIPARHAAVALLLEGSRSAQLPPVRQHPRVRPERAAALLGEELGPLVAGRTAATLILGAGLTAFGLPGLNLPAVIDEVLPAPAGQPGTGTWWELAGSWQRWAEQSRLVLVADYDPVLGYLSICAADFAASTVPASATLAGSAVRS
jgi:4-hydroxymandelate oxidase